MKQLKQCIKALKDGGLDVYSPAHYDGICTAPYCVVQFLGSFPQSGTGTGYDLLRVHLYTPIGQFSLMEELKRKAEKAMSTLIQKGAVRPCEGVGACTVDDTYKAHACYLDYRVQFGLNA